MPSKKLKGSCAILSPRVPLTISLYTMHGHMAPAAPPAHVQLSWHRKKQQLDPPVPYPMRCGMCL